MFRILEPKIENIFLLISFNICLDAQKNRLEYPQHVFWLINKENIFIMRSCLVNAMVVISHYFSVVFF